MGTFKKKIFWANAFLASLFFGVFFVFNETMQLKTALSIIIAYNLLSWFLFSWVSRPFERLSCEQNIPFLLEEFPRGESQTIAKNFNDQHFLP